MLIIFASVVLIVAGLIALLVWAVYECRRDRWLANLMHHQRAEWTRGYDGAYWPHSSDRDAHGGTWGVPGSRLPKERN